MIIFPNCKINLGLHVINKRPDGFHNIETVFYPVQWNDALEIIEQKKSSKNNITLRIHGMEIPGNTENNLCVRAFRLLQQDFKLPPVQIHLLKNIPMGAGLGGGSADAAFTIRLANEKFALKLSLRQMENYARSLGSDCAFFIRNQPVFATGRGDKFKNVQLSLPHMYIAVVHPGIHVGTAAAYAGVKKRGKENAGALLSVIQQPIDKWKKLLQNDFEESVLAMHPAIARLKEKMYDNGAVYASMSGSGSAVYGLFKDEPKLTASMQKMKHWVGKLQ